MTSTASRSASDKRAILPGATLGVLGGGQLGRMFTIAARRLGYRVHVFSPEDDTPTGQVADVEIKGAYDDLDANVPLHNGMHFIATYIGSTPVS